MSRTASVTSFVLVGLATALTVLFSVLAARAIDGSPLAIAVPWIPSLGIALAIRVDALSALFAIVISGVGAIVAAYSASYVEHEKSRFALHLALFMLAMLGVVLADDLLVLYVCWELTSVSSFFLIGFHHEDAEARAAARQALLQTVAGGLSLFAGLVVVGVAGGTTRISELLARGDVVREHALYLPALVLVALGAFAKSAQVPFHSWLPRAMKAPTPASAYLHAATMVKAGVYLLARLSPVLGGTPEWTALIATVGAITALTGAARALGETEVKRVLAYATVSALGILVTLIGAGTREAITAAMVYLVAHALYKGALFLFAGAIDHETGVTDLRGLHGLLRGMPRVSLGMALACASLAGVPLFYGFVGKDLAYEALWPRAASPWPALALLGAVLGASALFVAVALRFVVSPLRGEPLAGARDPSPALWVPPSILAALGLAAGLAPGPAAALCAAAASDVVQAPVPPSAAELHGLTPAMLLGLATLVLGVVPYLARDPLRRAGARVARALGLRPSGGYELALRALSALAERQTRVLASGYLRRDLMIIIGSATLLVALALVSAPSGLAAPVAIQLGGAHAGLTGLVLVAAVIAAVTESRFAAIAAMGVVGLALGLVYLTLGAPDLAMTQFVVEVLNIAVFVIAFYHLPAFRRYSSRRARARDAIIALAFGAAMVVVALAAGHVDPQERVSEFFVMNAVAEGHGHNVVNVIVTDFRSIDTLGEITVLATAALGVLLLLSRKKVAS